MQPDCGRGAAFTLGEGWHVPVGSPPWSHMYMPPTKGLSRMELMWGLPGRGNLLERLVPAVLGDRTQGTEWAEATVLEGRTPTIQGVCTGFQQPMGTVGMGAPNGLGAAPWVRGLAQVVLGPRPSAVSCLPWSSKPGLWWSGEPTSGCPSPTRARRDRLYIGAGDQVTPSAYYAPGTLF